MLKVVSLCVTVAARLFKPAGERLQGICKVDKCRIGLASQRKTTKNNNNERAKVVGTDGLTLQAYTTSRKSVLGGSWVVISGVISPLIGVITIVTLIITTLITNHEPPSNRSSRAPSEAQAWSFTS